MNFIHSLRFLANLIKGFCGFIVGMWRNNESDHMTQATRGFLTPPPKWRSPASEKNQRRLTHAQSAKPDLFHVIHKVPAGDSPYVRAKHVQVSAFFVIYFHFMLHWLSILFSSFLVFLLLICTDNFLL